jgi:hypothetical protein
MASQLGKSLMDQVRGGCENSASCPHTEGFLGSRLCPFGLGDERQLYAPLTERHRGIPGTSHALVSGV